MRALPVLFGLLLTASAAVSCSTSSAPVDGERIGHATLPIINGTPDTTHPAVVALLSQQSECSGTIFQVNGSTGFVLTAAHCCTAADAPQVVIQGTDYNSPSAIQYNVTAYKADPSYNQQIHDFCVVTFTGAGASTPVIPLMTKANDNLQQGDIVDFVGFGVTNGADPNNMNSKRMQVSQPLDQQLTAYTLQYSQTKSGPCSGDSGGPSLSAVGGLEYVSGVTSYGDQTCVQFGVSGRVSAVYDSFILPVVNGAPPVQDCNGCAGAATSGQGACISQTNACFADADCTALVTCFNNCNNVQSCIDTCAQQHPNGVTLYNTINDCICNTACVSVCASQCGPSSSSSSTSSTGGTSTSSTGSSGTTSSGGTSTSSTSSGGTGSTSSGQSSGGTSGGFGGDAPSANRNTPVTTGGCSISEESNGGSPLGGFALFGAAAAFVAIRRRRG